MVIINSFTKTEKSLLSTFDNVYMLTVETSEKTFFQLRENSSKNNTVIILLQIFP